MGKGLFVSNRVIRLGLGLIICQGQGQGQVERSQYSTVPQTYVGSTVPFFYMHDLDYLLPIILCYRLSCQVTALLRTTEPACMYVSTAQVAICTIQGAEQGEEVHTVKYVGNVRRTVWLRLRLRPFATGQPKTSF